MEHRNVGIVGYRGKERRRWLRSPPRSSASVKATVVDAVAKPAGRHGAIRSALPTFAKYRTWSVKAQTEWDEKK